MVGTPDDWLRRIPFKKWSRIDFVTQKKNSLDSFALCVFAGMRTKRIVIFTRTNQNTLRVNSTA